MERRVLVAITTSPFSDWKQKIAEIDKYGLEEIAFFPTFLGPEERKKAYDLLKKTRLKEIPHIHARDDMEEWEMDFFAGHYKTKVFNTHPGQRFYDLTKRNDKYKPVIYIENLYNRKANSQFTEKFFEDNKIAGVCLDFAHLERDRLVAKDEYERKIRLINKYSIGCNHAGAIAEEPRVERIDGKMKYDHHTIGHMSELDYLKNYPLKYFSKYISVEIDNPLDKLIKAKRHIERIIKEKENE